MKATSQHDKRSTNVGLVANATACTLVLTINLALLVAGILAIAGLAQ